MEERLLVEKYRPKKLEDCILPERLKTKFQSFLDKGDIPNLLLTGPPGIGKTTIAKILAEELKCDYIFVNASLHGNIDTLRNKIQDFASTMSLEGGSKFVILDEADYLTNASQPALRSFIEKFSKNCRFIFTCNFKERIIKPLHGRFHSVDFTLKKEEKTKTAIKFIKRLQDICKKENIECSSDTLQGLVVKSFPDFRKILNEIQGLIVDGKIDEEAMVQFNEFNLTELMTALKKKDFNAMRKWVVNNLDSDFAMIVRKIYDALNDEIKSSDVPQAILILHDYLYKSSFVIDHEINLVACLTELMTLEFK